MLTATVLVALVSFKRVAIPEDVPAHLCSAIAQDRQGLMWFGTQRGLVRYDGYELRVFRSDPANAATLGGNYVRSLVVAKDGRVWVGTFSGGLSVFDPRSETFTRFDRASLSYDAWKDWPRIGRVGSGSRRRRDWTGSIRGRETSSISATIRATRAASPTIACAVCSSIAAARCGSARALDCSDGSARGAGSRALRRSSRASMCCA